MSSAEGQVIAEIAALQGPARVARLPRQLSEPEFALFAGVGERRELMAGQTVFRRGEFGRSMFVIEQGRVLLEFSGDLPDKLIGPREFFGELALFIGNHARSGGAVTAEACVLRMIEQDAFDQLLAKEPRQLAHFMRRSFSYLVQSEQQLIGNYKRRNEDLMRTLDSLRQTQDQLHLAQRQVCTDDLTGLCNRRGLYRFLEGMRGMRDRERVLGLLLIDIDHFKQINDRAGHLTGDEVLRAIASEVQDAATAADLPARLGGDEFALLTQVRNQQELNDRALRVAEGVRQLRFRDTQDLRVSVSVGGSLCRDEAGWSVWYSEADCALYHVKGSGGDGSHVLS
ncbi:MAG: GGDEF domain-containing protein [Rhodanobacteraceae bacterium]